MIDPRKYARDLALFAVAAVAILLSTLALLRSPPAPVLVLDEAGAAHRILLGSYPVGGQTTVPLANGLNSNIATQGLSSIRIVGPTAPFTLGGFTPGQAGNELLVTNTTAQPMTVLPGDVSTTAKGQIDTQSGDGGLTLQPKPGALRFIYDGQEGKWVLSSTGPQRALVCNVLDYGADPGDTVDSTSAFTKALAACSAGGETRVPGGTYKLSGQLAVPVGETMRGDGMNLTTLKWTSATNGLALASGSVVLGGQTISDMALNGSGAGLVGLYVDNRYQVRIDRLQITGWTQQGEYWLNSYTSESVGCMLSNNGGRPAAVPITSVVPGNPTQLGVAIDAGFPTGNVVVLGVGDGGVAGGYDTGPNGNWAVTQVDAGFWSIPFASDGGTNLTLNTATAQDLGWAQVELDGCTTWRWEHDYISGGNATTPAGFRTDRSSVINLDEGAIESTGVNVQLGAKGENTNGASLINMRGVDMEGIPTTQAIEAGYGWHGATQGGSIFGLNVQGCSFANGVQAYDL
ncbi:MAG TPA: glycosyl hydrolase family 28-related protein, partial [Acidothermaceae bacterium]